MVGRFRAFGFLAICAGLLAACGSEVDVEPSGGSGGGGAGSGGTGKGTATGQTGTGTGTGTGQSGTGTATGTATASGTGTSTGTGSSTGTGTTICPSANPCGNCVSMACPEVWCDCMANPDCGAIFYCTQGCTDEDCVQGCLAAYPDGISDAILVGGCAADSCGASCPMADNPLSPCEECLYTSCDDEMNACLSNAECTGLWACFAGCGQFDLTCQQSCYATYPNGVEDLEDVLNCASMSCEMVCET